MSNFVWGLCSFEAMRASLRKTAIQYLQYLHLLALLVLSALLLSAQQSTAQVGIGISTAGEYTGTIGYNKGAVEGYHCPDGTLLRGLFHVDRSMEDADVLPRGMTSQVGLYCARVVFHSDGTVSTENITPDGTPTVMGYGYDFPGTVRHGYCPDGHVVARLGGYDRATMPSDYSVYWSSSLFIHCMPIQVGDNAWVEIWGGEGPEILVGVNEDDFAPHVKRGPFCIASGYRGVSGLYRQMGGKGYDGINVFCAELLQSRLSAYLNVENFSWDKTPGGGGWLVDLLLNNQVLEGLAGSGRNKFPYMSLSENDTGKFSQDHELYVLTGGSYGARLSQFPAGVPQESFIANSGSCFSGNRLQNREDFSCGIDIKGRPDIAIKVETTDETYQHVGETFPMTVSATNMGPGRVVPAQKFAVDVTIPAGWDVGTLPSGCAFANQKLTCQINQTLEGSSGPGQGGGSAVFNVDLIKNSNNTSPGSYPVYATLDRSVTDGGNNDADKDFNTSNDNSVDFVDYSHEPSLTLFKSSTGGTGSFSFSGNNGIANHTIVTTSDSELTRGTLQTISAAVATTVTENLPAGWVFVDAECRDGNNNVQISVDHASASFTIPASAITTDSDLLCAVFNQRVDISTKKTASVGANTPVQIGDTIIYTLTTTVVGGATGDPIELVDTLGAGLTYDGLVNDGGYNVDDSSQPVLKFTLPAGAQAGTHSVSYRAVVDQNAVGTVNNSVTVDGNSDCDDCSTSNPVTSISTTKSSNWPDGAAVQAGDSITYTLTVTVANGPTTQDTILTDTLSEGLSFSVVNSPGSFVANVSAAPTLVFTLPAGAGTGEHKVSYQASVDEGGTFTSVSNSVSANAGECDDCAVENPIVTVTTNKTSDADSNAGVHKGQTLTYEVTTEIDGGSLTHDLILTDTLGPGLTYVANSASSTSFNTNAAAAPELIFTLPAGSLAGTHKVTYQATVDLDATVAEVSNAIVPSDGGCINCQTIAPVAGVSSSKSANLTPEEGLRVGDEIVFTLTTVVVGAPTTEDVVLTDTLGAGLTFVSIEGTTPFAHSDQDATQVFTLSSPQDPGTYTVSYWAVVNGNANGPLKNSVTVSNGECIDCETTHPLIEVTSTKTSSPPSGTSVQVGDIITYTLTTKVVGGLVPDDIVLTDTLGPGLTFEEILSDNGYVEDVSDAPILRFQINKGAPQGTYEVVYTARVNANATSNNIGNSVTVDGTECDDCKTDHDLIGVNSAKTATPPSGTAVRPGDTLTFTLTTEITGAGSTREAVILRDRLGAGLTYAGLTGTSDFTHATVGADEVFTLAAGKSAGTYSVSYLATVNADATIGTIGNSVTSDGGVCDDCETEHDLMGISSSKSAQPPSGTSVQAGETLTFTLTTEVTGNGETPEAVILRDRLGAGLTFTGVTENTGGFAHTTDGADQVFTLAAGKPAGSYSVSYTATVNANATTSNIGNSVTGGGSECDDCETGHNLISVSSAKSAQPQSGTAVQAGEILTFTLTTEVSGDGRTREAVVLRDTLGAGLSFVGLTADETDFSHLTVGADQVFTLAAGKPAGSYSVSYTATVNANATTSTIGNSVTMDGGACDNCETEHDLIGVSSSKSAQPPSGTAVQAGETLTFTLTTEITGESATREDVVLRDTLGAGLTFVDVTADDTEFSHSTVGADEVFTLEAGKSAGIYSVSYTATVNEDATTSTIGNSVTSDGGNCGDCETEHDLIGTSSSKSAMPPSGTAVQVGETLTFTLTTLVAGDGETREDVVLRDTLGEGLTFIGTTGDATDFVHTTDGADEVFTLPAGRRAGSYSVSYTATVNADATSSTIGNSVIMDDGACDDCETEHDLIGVSSAKSAMPPSGTSVQAGETLTFTLTTTVSGDGETREDVVLRDTLGEGLSFVGLTADTTDFTHRTDGADEVFTLGAGKSAGIYSVSYTATVNEDATSGTIGNSVTGDGGECDNCETEHDLMGVSSSKSAQPPSGTAVQAGETLTFTLTTEITGDGETREDVVLRDTLGEGLSYVGLTADTTDFTHRTDGADEVFTLPAGKSAGIYSVSYTATVDEDATSSNIGNSVTMDDGVCDDCETEHDLIGVSSAKSAIPPSGTAVQAGETLTFTLTTTVSGDGETREDVVLRDTLGEGLTFIGTTGEPTDFEYEKDGAIHVFTLPAGQESGTYSVSYTATVDADATSGTIGNSVTMDGGTCGDCETEHKLIGVSSAKSAQPPSGTAMQAGETLTFTLTTTVSGDGETREDVVLRDTLGEGLSFVGLTADTTNFTHRTDGADEIFTLAAGKPAGTYSVSYTATLNDDATTGNIGNSVTGGGSTCEDCETEHNLIGISSAKSASPESGTAVPAGETITFTLTTIVSGDGETREDVVLRDTLGAGLKFTGTTGDTGGFTHSSDGTDEIFTLAAGQPAGTYSVSYTATVNEDALLEMGNNVTMNTGSCDECSTLHPLSPEITIVKTLVAESGESPGIAEPGEELTYQIALINSGGSTSDFAVEDVLDPALIFISADNGGVHDGEATGGMVQWTGLSIPPRDENGNGELVLTIIASVVDPLPENSVEIINIAREPGEPDPDCPSDACATIISEQAELSLVKTARLDGLEEGDMPDVGDRILYSFAVTNNGNVLIRDLSIEDAGPSFNGKAAAGMQGAVTPAAIDLEPGASATFTMLYTLAQQDIDNASGYDDGVENKATAFGFASGNQTSGRRIVSNESTALLTMPAMPEDISIIKTADISAIRRGEQAPFTIKVSNNSRFRARGLRVADTIPPGFRYVEDSAAINGTKTTPEINGRVIAFDNLTLNAGETTTINLRLLALSSAGPGKHINRAIVTDADGTMLAPEAQAVVEILVEAIFDCGDIIGRVFDDRNRNGYADDGEPGLPGVRLATAKGWLITTDRHGRFHVPCAALPDQRIGSNFIMKLDPRTLPSGYYLTSENPRVVRLTAGKMSEINFGAAMGRVVRLDLKDDAFEAGRTSLKLRWASGIQQLIEVLEQEQAILRLTYHGATVASELAQARLQTVTDLVRSGWEERRRPYRLEIETRLEAGR